MEATPDRDGAEEVDPRSDLRLRLRVAVVLTIPLVVISVGELWFPAFFRRFGGSFGWTWVQMVLATPVVFFAGAPFLWRLRKALRARRPDLFTLVALAMTLVYLYSVVATITPRSFPQFFRGPAGEVAVYFDLAAVLVTLVLLGLRVRRVPLV